MILEMRPMLSRCACLTLLFLPISVQAQTTVLYNESLGSLPTPQGWIGFSNISGASETYINNVGARVDSTGNNAIYAGYLNVNPISGVLLNGAFPSLDRTAGFSLRFDLSITTENHANNNRAGFSVILLGSDNIGVELGFWSNEIWAQNVGFIHGEGVSFTTSSTNTYVLNITGNNYELRANNTPILNGSVRDYSGFGAPYTYDNLVFLGDDTTSASADFTLGRVTIFAAVPEPATWMTAAVVAMGTVMIAGRTRKKH
jgi:hypothetical protein